MITVNYDLPLMEMIALGRYGWVSKDITSERFPITESGVKNIVPVIVHMGRYALTEEVIEEMSRRALRPANIAELLTYRRVHFKEQLEYPILALGSGPVISGRRDVVYAFYGHDGRRRLSISLWDGWCDSCRFLAVRNT